MSNDRKRRMRHQTSDIPHPLLTLTRFPSRFEWIDFAQKKNVPYRNDFFPAASTFQWKDSKEKRVPVNNGIEVNYEFSFHQRLRLNWALVVMLWSVEDFSIYAQVPEFYVRSAACGGVGEKMGELVVTRRKDDKKRLDSLTLSDCLYNRMVCN